jgi:hypothetical protein
MDGPLLWIPWAFGVLSLALGLLLMLATWIALERERRHERLARAGAPGQAPDRGARARSGSDHLRVLAMLGYSSRRSIEVATIQRPVRQSGKEHDA